MKISIIVGTRSQIIKTAPVVAEALSQGLEVEMDAITSDEGAEYEVLQCLGKALTRTEYVVQELSRTAPRTWL